jgi:N6-adenosine-specific RNA methylase IME4
MTDEFTGFRTILIDPPWPEIGGGRRGAQNHYPVVAVADLPGLILGAPVWFPAESCHLYLWATNTHLRDGLDLMEQLGFDYITTLTWTKDKCDDIEQAIAQAPEGLQMGLGYYFRGQTEQLLFGVRGPTLPPLHRDQGTAILEMRREHSRKPDQQYTRIEAVSRSPYLEMFCRYPRPGWYVWGNEV